MVCSISRTHSPPSAGHTGRTSIAMLCQDASNNLCPSNKLAIPALPLQGKSFRNGVRFSVHTTSWGSTPYKSCVFVAAELRWLPSGWKDMTGRVVRVPSIKLREAQKRPDSAFVSVSHLWSALYAPVSAVICIYKTRLFVLLVGFGLKPCPQLDAGSAFARAIPRPGAPALSIPAAQVKPQM